MLIDFKRGAGSIILRVKILHSGVASGEGLTGLTSASSGLRIAAIADNEAATTAYTEAGATIEGIAVLGTYAAPTATKARFAEVDAVNHKGIYEIQLADTRYAVGAAKSLLISISGAANLADCDAVIPLRDVDPYDPIRFGLTALPAVVSGNAGAVITAGTGTAQLSVAAGNISGSIGSLAAQAKADVNAEADTALVDIHLDHVIAVADPGGVVADSSFLAKLASKSGTPAFSSFDNTTDSLEALRDYGAPAATALSTVNWTTARAGYLDNLNIGGNVASSTEVTAIQNNTRVVRVVPVAIERPDAGTSTYRIELLLYDTAGNMETPDSAPTIALVDQGGTDLSARLDSATMALVETGRYRAIYTASDTDDLEQLVWTFSVVEGGTTRKYGNTSVIVDTTAVDFTSADRTKLAAVFDKLPSKAFIAGTTNSDGDVQLDEATGALTVAAVENVWAAGTRTLTAATNITSTGGTIPISAGVVSAATIIRTGTAQNGNPSSITLDSGASAIDNFYRYLRVRIDSGPGAGQARFAVAYDGPSKYLAITPAWTIAPDSTSTYILEPQAAMDLALWSATAPNLLVSGRVDAYLGATAAGVIAASTFATGAIDAAAVATSAAEEIAQATWTVTARTLSAAQTFDLTGNITGNLSGTVGSVVGAVGSVTGAVGSVTGNVGGNVTGSVGSLATQAKADVNAEADAALADVGVTTTVTGRIDVAVSTRLATAGYTAPDNATIVAIAGFVDTEVAAIKAKTDLIPGSPAAVGSAMTLTVAYDAAKTAAQAGDAMTVSAGGVAAILAGVVEGTVSVKQAIRALLSALGGEVTGAGELQGSETNELTFASAVDPARTRITADGDRFGNRSNITLDLED